MAAPSHFKEEIIMSMFTVISLTNEGTTIALYTEDKTYHISGAFRINTAMLRDFIESEGEALYDFDLHYALRLYRVSDSSVSMHLTWLSDSEYDAYAQSCILPVSFIKRVIGGKAVRAVVENHFCYYDPRIAKEHLFTDKQGLMAACCM